MLSLERFPTKWLPVRRQKARRDKRPGLHPIASRPGEALASRFLADQRGATAIEYGLIIGLVALVIVGSVTTIGTKLSAIFNRASNF